MPKVTGITLDTSKLDKLMSAIPGRAETVLDKIAFDVEAKAKPLTNLDTGAMRSSIYVSGASGGGDYGAAAADAMGRRQGVKVADEVTANKALERVVGVGVEYGYWQELQKPFLEPAIEEERPKAVEAWKALFTA